MWQKPSTPQSESPTRRAPSTNALEVRVAADKIDYVVNGTVVHSTPKTGATAKTDGLYGFRSNHRLEVMVDGLAVRQVSRLPRTNHDKTQRGRLPRREPPSWHL